MVTRLISALTLTAKRGQPEGISFQADMEPPSGIIESNEKTKV